MHRMPAEYVLLTQPIARLSIMKTRGPVPLMKASNWMPEILWNWPENVTGVRWQFVIHRVGEIVIDND